MPVALGNGSGPAPRVRHSRRAPQLRPCGAAGVGVAFVPASAARIAPSAVTIAPIDHLVAVWRIGVAWNGERRTAVVRNFLEVVRDVCAV
ncbi:LysR substrate-binding domain-containing protein [Microbispora siamensis]